MDSRKFAIVLLVVGMGIGFLMGHLVYSPMISSLESKYLDLKTKYEMLLRNLTRVEVKPLSPMRYWVHLKLEGGKLSMYHGRLVKVFKLGEEIRFALINGGNNSVTLPNTAPWRLYRIEDGRREFVYQPIAAQMLVRLDPGKKISWSWNQKTNKDLMVTPGEYEVCISIVELGETCLKFVISEAG